MAVETVEVSLACCYHRQVSKGVYYGESLNCIKCDLGKEQEF